MSVFFTLFVVPFLRFMWSVGRHLTAYVIKKQKHLRGDDKMFTFVVCILLKHKTIN